jgi:hypothetical protein
MAIVPTDFLGGQRPERASCDWSTADVRNWRYSNAAGFQLLQARTFDSSGGGGPVFGVTGGWWSGVASDGVYAVCGGSDPLVTFGYDSEKYVWIDIWKALALGLWTSSVAFSLVPAWYPPGASSGAGIWLGPQYSAIPATIGPLYKTAAYPGSCANPATWTITVRDDGTFSVG